MTGRVNEAAVYNDLSGLASLKRDAVAQSPDALHKVAKQFESLFTRMMLKSMRDASMGDSLLGSDQQDFYRGMFDDQLAVELSKGRGMGLADMLVKQLSQAGLAGQLPQTDPIAQKEAAASPGVSSPSAANKSLPLTSGTKAADAQLSIAPDSKLFFPLTSAPGASNVLPLTGTPLSMSGSLGAAGATSAAAASVDVSATPASDSTAPPTTWRPASKDEFIRDLWPAAQEAAKELGVDPRSLLAQAALESNWGRSMPRDAHGNASFNLFGIKATGKWDGKAAVANTLEVENGVAVKSRERFRAYDSPLDSFCDYVALIRNNPRYAAALNTGSDTHAFAAALQRGGYATDPAYAQKVSSIAQNMAGPATALKYAAALPMNTDTRTL